MRLRIPSVAPSLPPSVASGLPATTPCPFNKLINPTTAGLRSFTALHPPCPSPLLRSSPLPPSLRSLLTAFKRSPSSSPAAPPSPLLSLSMFPLSLLSSMPWWAVLLLCYASLSGVLLAYPQLLSPLRPKKAEVAFPVRYGAHRGGGGERPENTLAAFDHAVECGCTLLELDVHLTRDGQVVVFHDASTARTTGRSMLVTDTNFDDLPLALSRLPAPPPFSPPGSMMTYHIDAPQGSAEHRHAYGAPLLRTVLQRYTQSVVNIDMKSHSHTTHAHPHAYTGTRRSTAESGQELLWGILISHADAVRCGAICPVCGTAGMTRTLCWRRWRL